MAGAIVSCEQEPTPQGGPTPVDSVTITPSTCEIMIDEELTLTVEVEPADTAFSTEFTWKFAGCMMPMNGQMPQMFKGDDQTFYSVRAILAF